ANNKKNTKNDQIFSRKTLLSFPFQQHHQLLIHRYHVFNKLQHQLRLLIIRCLKSMKIAEDREFVTFSTKFPGDEEIIRKGSTLSSSAAFCIMSMVIRDSPRSYFVYAASPIPMNSATSLAFFSRSFLNKAKLLPIALFSKTVKCSVSSMKLL